MARGRGYLTPHQAGQQWRYQYRGKYKTHIFPEGTSQTRIENTITSLIAEHKEEVDKEASTKDTFRSCARKWLKLQEGKIQPRTIERYRQDLEKHVIPAFGDLRIDEITTKQIKDFLREKKQAISEKTGKGYSKNTIRLMMKASVIGCPD